MKKIFFTLLPILTLSSCSKAGGSKGVIECSYIKLSGGNSQTFTPEIETSRIHEYKSDSGKLLYCESNYTNILNVVSYKSETSEYAYSRLVGYISSDYSYYLHLESKTIETRIKYTEYKDSTAPDGTDSNSKEAYKCAKKGFINQFNSNGGTSIYIDDIKYSLEYTVFIKLGKNTRITYTPKD